MVGDGGRRSPGRRGASLAAAGLLAALPWVQGCEAPTFPLTLDPAPYDFRLILPGDSLTFRWDPGATVPVAVVESPDPGRPSLTRALRNAASRWNEAAVFREVRLVEAPDLGAARALLRWSDVPAPLTPPGQCVGPVIPGAAATRGCILRGSPEEGGEAPRRLIPWLLPGGDTSQVRMEVVLVPRPGTSEEEVRRLVAHEMGHVVGILNHSQDPKDLMWGGELAADTLTGRDRATFRALYQSPRNLLP